MGYIVDGFVNASVNVSGVELPLGPDTCRSLSIIQSVNNLTAVVEGNIVDKWGYQAISNIFSDGAPIIVTLGPGNNMGAPMKFIRFNNTEITHAYGADIISFSGQADIPGLRNLQTKSLGNQSSSSAIQSLVSGLGINFSGDSTNDSMTWLPNNRPIGQLLRYIADHGYISSQSSMALAMGTRGDGKFTMLYKDLIGIAKSTPTARIVTRGFDQVTDIPAIVMSSRSHSGTLNSLGGYAQNLIQISHSGSVTDLSNVVVNLVNSGSLDMSSAIKSAVSSLPYIVAPIDSGNTHQNFTQALYQNTRLKQTFTQFITVITDAYTNLQIMDNVKVLLYQADRLNNSVSGNYVVHGRTQHISSIYYREMITLASQTLGVQNNN